MKESLKIDNIKTVRAVGIVKCYLLLNFINLQTRKDLKQCNLQTILTRIDMFNSKSSTFNNSFDL